MVLRTRQPAEATADRDSPPEAAQPPQPTLMLTYDGWLLGHLVDTTGRVSDALSSGPSVRLLTDDGLRDVDLDEVLMIVPPKATSRAELRIAKRRIPVTVDVAGALSVSGLCHLLPGATVWDTWQRSPSGFAPLTDAVIAFPDGTTETADVILVSRYVAGAGLRSF